MKQQTYFRSSWLFILLLFGMFAWMLYTSGGRQNELSSQQFQEVLEQDEIMAAEIKQNEQAPTGVIRMMLNDGNYYEVNVPDVTAAQELLDEKGVDYVTRDVPRVNYWLSLALPVIMMVGTVVVLVLMMNMKAAGGGGANAKMMNFGKSRARMTHTSNISFKNVAGLMEEKEDLEEMVDFLRNPQKYTSVGARIPKGVILVGPPGTGKTLLAKAVAGEANVPFFSISGSDFVEMFVGVGASRVRDMFAQAKKNAPCLLFIDEIDAVGRHRGAGLGGGNDEREQTLNQLLVEMDGFEPNENVILIAATNRPDVLDPALLRPGRFDRQVTVTNPDIKGREDILKVHTRKVPLAKDVNLSVIARGTPGFSGADLANLVNEAALLAARKNKNKVTSKDFDDAKDKVLMGNERRSMAMDEAEKKLTAYHEAGHAICSLFVPDTDPIHKATIIPRGRALGMVQQLPEKDQYSYSRSKMLSRLIILMGGRVAEELKFGYDKVTSGASSDIAAATNLARSMVTEWGMSDKLGPVLYAENSGEVFLGKSVTQNKNMSEDTARLVDAEIKRLVTESFEGAQKLLKEKNKEWETLAQALMEYETLTGDEIKQVLAGEKVDKSKECPVCEEKRTHASIPEI